MARGFAVRVVHSCTSESFSGLERYVLELATEQYRASRNVELFCRDHTELCEAARARGLPVWTIAPNAGKGPATWLAMRGAWSERLRAGPVTLHMHAGGEPWYHLPWLTARPGNLKKTILQYHLWINHEKRDPLHWAVFRGVDEIWSASELAQARLRALLPVHRDRFRVVPYGRDVQMLTQAPAREWRTEVRARFQIPESEILGVCVSRIEPVKGIGELFDGFCAYAETHEQGTLMIVGSASPRDAQAESFASDLKARHERLPAKTRQRLLMPGYLPDVERVLAAGDFYIVPAYEECHSLAMLDAAILGRPILGTNSGGTPSVVRPGETGELIPPRDAGAMAAGLEKMFSDAPARERWGARARELGQRYDRQRIFDDIWRSY